MNAPAYTLKCGHIICRRSARDFGIIVGRKLTMAKCPLHCSLDEERRPLDATRESASGDAPNPEASVRPAIREPSLSIVLPPAFSGCRTPALDG